MPTIRAAVIFSSVSKYSLMMIGLLSTMVVARLLTPEEIGTFAVASGLVMLASEFRILGAGAYLVRESELTPQKVRSALGLTILISWGLGITVCLTAPLVASFYDLPPLKPIFWILSVSFFLAPFISITAALLARSFRFDLQFRMQLSAAIVGFAVTVILIYAGASYYALAWGNMAGNVARLIVAVLLTPKLMSYRPSFRNLRPVVNFGVFSSIANITRRFTVVAPDLVIGKLGSTYEVGIFSRGLGFIQFVAQSLMMSVAPVALPYLSNTRREGGDVCAAYQRASVLLGGIVWPVLAVASLSSLPAIRLFFGEQWDAAAPLAGWLAIWSAFRSVHWFSNDMLMATHREKVMVVKEVAVFGVLLIGIIAAYPAGLERIAQVFLAVGLFEVLLITAVLKIYAGLDVRAFLWAWLPNAASAAVCAGVTLMIRQWLDFDSDASWKAILALAVIMPPVWLMSLRLFHHPLFDEVMGLITGVRRKLR